MSPAKTAEPIEMPFGLRTLVSLGNDALDGDPDPPWGWEILRVKGRPIVKYRDTAVICATMAEPIKTLFWVVGVDGFKEAYIRWGPDSYAKGQLLLERTCLMTLCHELCKKMAEPIDLPFWL